MRRTRQIVAVLIFAAWAVPHAIARDTTLIDGIHGEDDRKLVDSSKAPWSAVGRVNIKGYRKRRHCTGTLVKPNKVITAAHCLVDSETKQPFSEDRIFFLAGLEQGEHRELGQGECVSFLNQSGMPYSSYKDDVALITLTESLTSPPLTVLTRAGENGEGLVHAGYTRDRPFSLAADDTCSLVSQSDGMWLSDCDTNFGASGGPVMVLDERQLRIGGIMIGYTSSEFSLALPHKTWAHLLNQSNCQ